MHILLTDILTCPRCGPGFGLILLADDVADRRVRTGLLGCPNCREQYRIRDGVPDFGEPPAAPDRQAEAAPAADDPEALTRLAAMLGVTAGPGFVLLIGPAAARAPALARLLNGVEVMAAAYGHVIGDVAAAGVPVNRLRLGAGTLPFASAKVLGVALTGRAADELLEEGARVTSPLGRLVLRPIPPDAEDRLTAAGLRVLARDATTVVAGRH